MYSMIKESPRAMESVKSVLDHAGVDYSSMSDDDKITASSKISAPCAHKWDKPYKGQGTRKCLNCGDLQDN